MTTDARGGSELSPAVAVSAASRTRGVLAVVDRWFPVGWIAFYLALPISGWSTLMLRQWADQVRDLEALKSLIADGHAATISANAIGPAYIGTAAAVHWLLGTSPENSLIVLTRASYAVSVALALLLVGVLVRRLVGVPPLVSIGAQFALLAMVFAAGTWHWSDVPWSHFFAMALAIAIYAARFAPARLRAGHAVVIGLLLSLLYLTRSFEFAAIVLAWLIGAALILALRLRPLRTPSFVNLIAGAASFAVAWVVVNVATGKSGFFLLYGNHLNEQRSTVDGRAALVPVAHMPTFSPSFVPTKLVQLFVEPCYYSMCSVANYAGGAPSARGEFADAAGSELLWRQPLAIQLPSLLLLPLCVVGVAVLLVWGARHRREVSGAARELQSLVEMTVAASGLVLGYAASTMIGSSHLRYGLARDFLFPALLTSVVAVTLASGGLWRLLSSRKWRVSPESGFVVLSVVAAFAMVAGVAYARAYGIPRLEGRQLGKVTYTASCRGGICDISVDAKTTHGHPMSIPEPSTLTFECGDNRGGFTIYARSLAGGVRLPSACPHPALTHAWPTVAGLPPGTYELFKAVQVSNT
jgi:hypothetical protein